MKFHLNRNIDAPEAGLMLQPNLLWLTKSPDGLVSDKSKEEISKTGLPYTNTNILYTVLKYYTHIQMTMGLSQITFSDFILYTFDSSIMIRTQFDADHFFVSTAKTKYFPQRLYATKTSNHY